MLKRLRVDVLFALVVLLGISVLCPPGVNAAKHYVPAEGSIQEVIDTAEEGDMIIISPGTYTNTASIDFNGKSVTLTSVDLDDPTAVINPDSVVIDGDGNGSVIVFCRMDPETYEIVAATNPVLVGLTITNGSAVNGGGVYCGDPNGWDGNGMNALIKHCKIVGNTADYGGGIASSASSLTIIDCEISDNTAVGYGYYGGGCGGGVISWWGNSRLTMTDCTVKNNQCGSMGGGVTCANGTFTNCTVTRNSSGNEGGGLDCGTGLVDNCTIAGNTALWGGGVCIWGSGSLTNCTITGNSAEWGGGIEMYGGATITGCTISSNSAAWGAGIAGDVGGNVIQNCIISENTLTPSQYSELPSTGAGIFCQGNDVIRNCTFANNSGGIGTGIISYCWFEGEQPPVIANCIFWGDNSVFPEIAFYDETPAPEVTYSDVRMDGDDVYPGTGNISSDPLFADDVYHLSTGSPCIGTGKCGADMGRWGIYIECGMVNPPVADAGEDQTTHVGLRVTLDGTGSSDPDGETLTFAWSINSKPDGSIAELDYPGTVNPSFLAELPGDYTLVLVVTDQSGLSNWDEVIVSTTNSKPVADAGSDILANVIGQCIQLDGNGSFDNDGDVITYLWSFIAKPAGSSAELAGADTKTPSFTADVHGDYVVGLIVNDSWSSSDLDTVVVSFTNVKPIADAGINQTANAGDTIYLDGSNSSDGNNDPLTYFWSIVSKPAGSTAELSSSSASNLYFTADKAGSYIISLVVNDGFENSEPCNITVTATSVCNSLIGVLRDLLNTLNSLDDSAFKNKNMKHALTNKVNAAIEKVEQGLYQEASDKLVHDILKKTDGCANEGSPDKTDWIVNCTAQNPVYPLVTEAISILNLLI